jgi:hypothetical protein
MARLDIVKSLHIEAFTGTGIDAADFFNTNAIIGKYDDGRIYATQRPSIDIFDDASTNTGVEAKGRGVYFWTKADDRYIVNDSKVYKGSTDIPANAIGTISAGTGKVYFVEMVSYLVILDPDNNEGWYIHTGDFSAVVEIVDAEFPGNIAGVSIIAGGAFLDGRLYVGGVDANSDANSIIYASDSNTPVDWTGGATVSAEREADGGVYLDKHLDHIVMFGERTIEFFYNAAVAAPASPLARRRDVFHNIGMMQGNAAWREGDNIYFVGVYPSGPLEIMRLENFQPVNISTPEIESYITNARLVVCATFHWLGGQSEVDLTQDPGKGFLQTVTCSLSMMISYLLIHCLFLRQLILQADILLPVIMCRHKDPMLLQILK